MTKRAENNTIGQTKEYFTKYQSWNKSRNLNRGHF